MENDALKDEIAALRLEILDLKCYIKEQYSIMEAHAHNKELYYQSMRDELTKMRKREI